MGLLGGDGTSLGGPGAGEESYYSVLGIFMLGASKCQSPTVKSK